MTFKPTLACNADLTKLTFPVYASHKLDGIRCAVVNGKALSRTLKPIPNKDIFGALSRTVFEGFDGELIVGSPTDKDCYTKTVSKVMSFDKGLDDVTYYVFDKHNVVGGYTMRLDSLCYTALPHANGVLKVCVLPQQLIENHDELNEYEARVVADGHEGIILRSPTSPYKHGRSTVNEGFLLKVKRFSDSEAEIIGFDEEMFNGNVAETNELGRTKRSTHAAGLVGKGTLGAFLVRDIGTKVEFAIGTGLTADQRQVCWNNRTGMVGTLIKYKFFNVGVKDKPRHPVFIGMRDRGDL